MEVNCELVNEEKVVLITGATQGIGEATALKFAKEGYQVAINCRNKEKYQEGLRVVAACEELSEKPAICVIADVSKSEECKRLVNTVIEKWGHIDVLVNNAGIMKYSLLHRMEEAEYKKVISNNQDSVFYMLKYAISYMVKRKKGKIINVASMAGVKGTQCLAAYSASKGAVIAMTKAVAAELASKNINVNAVAPGMVGTKMTEMFSEKQINHMCAQICLHRFADASEVANAIAWLASEEANYITGHVLEISGGM